MNEIVIAIITSVFTFAGVVITVVTGNKKTEKTVKAQSDVTLYRISELEKKVEEYNNLTTRMFDVESRLGLVEQRIRLEHPNHNPS